MNRRSFVAALTVIGLGLGLGFGVPSARPDEPVRVVIDADSANEIDDLYAIVRALVAPEYKVVGVTSAHWMRSTEPNATVHRSQELHERLLDRMGLRETVPHPLGADRSMPDPATPIDSPAARHIIALAHAGGPDDKLLVMALGAPTNLASALLLDPSIEPKVTFAFIDGDYKNGRWGPGIFNWKNDIHAVRAIFESKVDYFHMPAKSVSVEMVLTKQDVDEHLKGRGGAWDFLVERWETFPRTAGKPRKVMWDVALVEAMLRPDLATRVVVGAPIIRDAETVEQHPDNPRRVTVFEAIDAEGMARDFWKALDAAVAGHRSP
ncbi:nucleoside hydrolase [Planctomyces sp. SH-PL62]|uniref:nucleoside hydrolase n=1 Tax=Planctomyces sp. SH-PL62 TaxID=1636152 RepID=UPI00078EED65|nr:nucleoside hydrolase [Planctomyces sp. SH-PL62]AMV38146.1 Inosine-uridine preferring nucleoside hydrolase [Planctomyces sp. SH-PL62]